MVFRINGCPFRGGRREPVVKERFLIELFDSNDVDEDDDNNEVSQ